MAEQRNQAGFLLLEVLVAVAVTAILLVALIRAFNTIWHESSLVREEADGMIVANYVLDATTVRASLAPGVREGLSGRYKWTIAITEI